MPAASITLIISPYHAGEYNHRVGGGPLRILSHGLATRLENITEVSFINIAPVDEFEGEAGKTFEILRRTSKAVSQAVKNNSFPIVLSGNCQASAAVVAGLGGSVEDLGCMWIDAHDDLDTPATNENGYLDAMAASMMAGLSWQTLMNSVPGHKPFDLRRGLWCGLRDVSDIQRKTIEEAGIDVVWGGISKMGKYTPEISAALKRKGFQKTHIHLDLDVIDESIGRVNDWPSPGGFLPSDLLDCMEMIPNQVVPTSLVVCSFNPRLEGGDTVANLTVKAIETFAQGLVDSQVLASTK